jgi:hypothetical protein
MFIEEKDHNVNGLELQKQVVFLAIPFLSTKISQKGARHHNNGIQDQDTNGLQTTMQA